MSVETDESVHTSDAIAIIGMAGRFPGASSVPELWQNLLAGKTAITRFTGAAKGPGEPVHARGVVSGVDAFDYEFFGCNAREAQILDPQQRLFLECSWQAFEAAGHVPARCEGKVGVYASSYLSTYLLSHLLPNTELVKEVGMVAIHQANVVDQLAPRVSYKLGLEGPSIGVQTACSSSLVAVHLACQALLTGECDLALAGGVSVVVPEDEPYTRMPGGMTSPQGLCRTFDARADGTVFSNGVGVVLLKRLDEALRDRDPVVAIIRGSAVNNDGASKVGYTAPGVEGQVRVVEAALHMAQVSPGSVGFIEAHGTGTDLGDAIEVRALAQLFPAEPGAPCLLGSLKANLGHLDNAAGVTGLIKAALSVREGMVPGTAHFEAANPKLELERTRFVVTSHTSPWQGPLPRRAGVSAFGIGGTNAHVVLEQPPEQSTSERAHAPAYLCVLSARSASALEMAKARLLAHLSSEQGQHLTVGDVCYTLALGRSEFAHRWSHACSSRESLIAALSAKTSASTTAPRLGCALRLSGRLPTRLARELCAMSVSLSGSKGSPLHAVHAAVNAVEGEWVTGELAERLEGELVQLLSQWGVRPKLTSSQTEPSLLDLEACADYAALLARIGALWSNHAVEIGWQGLFAEHAHRRVALPTYPFERRRCWIDRVSEPAAPEADAQARAAVRSDDPASWLYAPLWREVLGQEWSTKRLTGKHNWLVFAHEGALSRELVQHLQRSGQLVTVVHAAEQFRRVERDLYTIRRGHEGDHLELLSELRALAKPPTRILHLWNTRPIADHQLEAPLFDVVALSKAFSRFGVTRQVRLGMVTAGLCAFGEAEQVQPEKSLALGALRVLPQEMQEIEARVIDVEQSAHSPALAKRLVLFTEHGTAPLVAMHGQRIWQEEHAPVGTLPDVALERDDAQPVYLVTGGLGGVGGALARHLAREPGAKLILLSRSELPAREHWAAHEEREPLGTVAAGIRTLRELEALGCEVLPVSADVADAQALERAVETARTRFGQIQGVIHAAGVSGGGLLATRTNTQIAQVLRAKLTGTRNLLAALAGEPLSFFVLCSSMAAVLGGPGQGDYAAANAYLDAFAEQQRARGIPMTSINWDTFNDVGMAVSASVPEELRELHRARLEQGHSSLEAIRVFELVRRAGLARVAVSPVALTRRQAEAARLLRGAQRAGSAEASAPAAAASVLLAARVPRPALEVPYVAPETELEKRIAEVLQSLVGIEQVGVEDDFFDLGGNSLLATQATSRLREMFGIDLPIAAILEQRTVGELAIVIEELLIEEAERA